MKGQGAGGPDGPPDTTNSGAPGPGGSLSGDLTRTFAIKRIEKKQRGENKLNTSPTNAIAPPAKPPPIVRF